MLAIIAYIVGSTNEKVSVAVGGYRKMKLRLKLLMLAAIPTVAITALTILLIAGPFELTTGVIALILILALIVATVVTTFLAMRISQAITASVDAVKQVSAMRLIAGL